MRVLLISLIGIFSISSFAQFEPKAQRYNIRIKRSAKPRFIRLKIEAQLSDIKGMRIDKDHAFIIYKSKGKRRRKRINFQKLGIDVPLIAVGQLGEISFEIDLPKKRGLIQIPIELISLNEDKLSYWIKISLRKKPYRLIIAPRRGKKTEATGKPDEDLTEKTADEASQNREKAVDYSKVKHRISTSFGVGANYLDFQQTNASPTAKTGFSSILSGATFFDFDLILSQEWSVRVETRSSPGEVGSEKSGELLTAGKYTWVSSTLEANYINRDVGFSLLGKEFYYQMKFGLQTHSLPLLRSVDQGSGVIAIENIDKVGLTNLSVGMGVIWQGKWRPQYGYFLRYQHMVSTSGDYKIKPELIFDGALGMTIPFESGFKFGVFWYGQYHGFKYTSKLPQSSSSGKSKLLYSNIDLRFGYSY